MGHWLPDVADVITVGQGYVNEGEIVDPDFGTNYT
jgi:hypothetical protein